MANRRDILKSIGAASLAANLPGLTLARVETDARLVFVVLRGAVDGLAMVAPYGDGKYRKVRGELAIDKPGKDGGLLKLDGMFGLHPSMSDTYSLFEKGELLPIHAVASPYRERSHFDGQDVLENGALHAGDRRDGWLNRAIAPLGGTVGHETAIALSQNTPLVLRGDNSATSWAPSQLPDADDSTLGRIASMYSQDEFFATRLAQALESQEIAGNMEAANARRRGNDRERTRQLAEAAGRFLRAADGPRVAVLEYGGWDTHANQGAATGGLANNLAGLDSDLAILRRELGPAWQNTIVVVATEFGRTVKVNGTRGTDHGTASAALLLGGAVNGGRVHADWPGLGNGDLYEGRDLRPTLDLRSVFKGVLSEHLWLDDNFIEQAVFPDSAAAKPVRDIVRG